MSSKAIFDKLISPFLNQFNPQILILLAYFGKIK